MDVEFIEQDNDRIRFILEGTTPAFVNALRRTMISKVPTLAIKEVDFVNNTSGLFDEIVAHRLGMIPWDFDPEHYQLGDDGPQEQVEMVLKKEGPGLVKASDLKPTDKEVSPVNPDIVIAKLLEDQELNLEARAVVGTGDQHAKYQAAIASYMYYPEISINGTAVDNPEDIVKTVPDDVQDADGPVEADSNIVYAMEGVVDIEEGDDIEVERRDDKFVVTVESVSGLEPQAILERALDTLEADLDAFHESAQATLQDA
jgi:DNA-directed RNA polymerase subunit D